MCHVAPPTNLSRFTCLYSFLTQFFEAAFGGLLVLKMGHVGPLEILISLLSNDINFTWIEVRTEKLWLLEVGSSELFFRLFLAKIPTKWEMLPANRELRLVARVAVFLKVPRSQIKSQQVGRNLRTKAVIREEKRVGFSARFPYFRQFLRAQ
jgi:hypothetical protein